MSAAGSAGLLGTVYTAPAGAVRIAAGSSIQAAVDANPAGTAFLLSAGTYSGQAIRPKNGNSFYGENGNTVLDGNGAAHAFRGQGASNVTVAGLEITDYAPPKQGIGVFGTDASSQDWKVIGNEIHHINNGAAVMLGTRMEVRGNTISDNAWTGVSGWNVRDASILDNEIARNAQAGSSPFTATGDTAGIKLA